MSALRIGARLVSARILNAEQVELVLEHQRAHGGRFASVACTLGFATAPELTTILAQQKRCAGRVIEETPVELVRTLGIPIPMLQELGALPVKASRRTVIFAVNDPSDSGVCGALQAVCSLRVQPVIALNSSLRFHLDTLDGTQPAPVEPRERTIEPTPAPMALPPVVQAINDSVKASERRSESRARAREALKVALLALRSEDFAAAVSAARESMRSDPFDPRAAYALARGLHGARDHSRCLTALDQTLALEPNHYGAWRLRAMVCESMGLMDQALAAWQKASDSCDDADAVRMITARMVALRGSCAP